MLLFSWLYVLLVVLLNILRATHWFKDILRMVGLIEFQYILDELGLESSLTELGQMFTICRSVEDLESLKQVFPVALFGGNKLPAGLFVLFILFVIHFPNPFRLPLQMLKDVFEQRLDAFIIFHEILELLSLVEVNGLANRSPSFLRFILHGLLGVFFDVQRLFFTVLETDVRRKATFSSFAWLRDVSTELSAVDLSHFPQV